jgi:hypothetical protein
MQLNANSGVLMRPATCMIGHAPVLDINQPASGTTFYEKQVITLIANAQDLEDGDLGVGVRWSSDLSGVLGSGAVLDVTLPVGNHILSATVNDRDGNTVTVSASITVLFNNPPQLIVTTPEEGLTTEQWLPLTLSATAFDQEDGDLSMSINWSSDLAGVLGTGNEVSVTLEPGTHQISANVTDVLGKTVTITRSVNVSMPPVLDYCNASGRRDPWIESVTVAGITNNSGSQGGYGDFTGQAPIYLERTTNSVELIPGYSRRYREANWAIWIDLNRDGVFDNDERLLTGESNATITGNLVIPATAAAGLTRMRIMAKRKRIRNSCQRFKYGEVEDYSVVLLP